MEHLVVFRGVNATKITFFSYGDDQELALCMLVSGIFR